MLLDRSRTFVAAAAIVLLLGVFAARITGPSDLFHHSQPKTVGYTSDIIANGRWMLPYEQDIYPATKPPLFNWLAAPFVAVFGFDSEIAHKMPSILALIGCVGLTVFLGERMVRERAAGDLPLSDRARSLRGLGWLAGIMLIANYTVYTLGYLARPDMLLTVWLLISWWSATEVLIHAGGNNRENGRHSLPLFVFWFAVALAWLTKGPVALVPLVYALLGAKFVTGQWRAVHAFKWWIGVPLSTLPFALWVWGVYLEAPDFLINTLWKEELAGRLIGSGTEGPADGAAAWYRTVAHMFVYYLTRGAPWSLLSIIAMFLLWRKNRRGDSVNFKRMTQPAGIWLHAAAVWTILVLVVFTLSAGKRAAYIASAFPTGSILAAWFWLTFIVRPPAGGVKRWMSEAVQYRRSIHEQAHLAGVVLIAAASIIGMAVVERWELQAPERHYGDHINAFFREVARTIPDDNEPVLLLRSGTSHLAAFLGRGRKVSRSELFEDAIEKRPFWVIEGVRDEHSTILADDKRTKRRGMTVTSVLESEVMKQTEYWPRQLIVSHVTFEDR